MFFRCCPGLIYLIGLSLEGKGGCGSAGSEKLRILRANTYRPYRYDITKHFSIECDDF